MNKPHTSGKTIRHTIDFLWKVILSLLITEFIKGSCRIAIVHPSASNFWTIAACAIFLGKHALDLILYYEQLDRYEPVKGGKNTFGTMLRYLLENFIEVAVIVLVFAGVQVLSVNNYPDHRTVTGDLSKIAGESLLLSAGMIELCWLAWDVLFIIKRQVGSSPQWSKPWSFRSLRCGLIAFARSGDVADVHTRRWLIIHCVWPEVFIGLYIYFKLRLASLPAPDWQTACILLFVPVTVHCISHLIFLRGYYLGDDG
jgi:hypothetical protein